MILVEIHELTMVTVLCFSIAFGIARMVKRIK